MFGYLFLKGSTCFGRFFRPTSGAHNCTFSFRYCQPILLQDGVVDEMELISFNVFNAKTVTQISIYTNLNILHSRNIVCKHLGSHSAFKYTALLNLFSQRA